MLNLCLKGVERSKMYYRTQWACSLQCLSLMIFSLVRSPWSLHTSSGAIFLLFKLWKLLQTPFMQSHLAKFACNWYQPLRWSLKIGFWESGHWCSQSSVTQATKCLYKNRQVWPACTCPWCMLTTSSLLSAPLSFDAPPTPYYLPPP